MTNRKQRPIPLAAISTRQQTLVEAHIPLVHLTLNRHSSLTRPHRPGRDTGELLQEGCLALVEAVRTHDPNRHGTFAAFAMARIHYAMSRYAHEQHSLIRIPFITQRRRRELPDDPTGRRHRPDPLPRVVTLRDDRHSRRRISAQRRQARSFADTHHGVTVGDLVRECYDRVTARVLERMKHTPRATSQLRTLLDRCAEERWTVPEPEARTSVRKLAGALGCSIGRITHSEERFRTQTATLLEADRTYRLLLRLGRKHADGWRRRLTDRELAYLRRLPHDNADSKPLAESTPNAPPDDPNGAKTRNPNRHSRISRPRNPQRRLPHPHRRPAVSRRKPSPVVRPHPSRTDRPQTASAAPSSGPGRTDAS